MYQCRILQQKNKIYFVSEPPSEMKDEDIDLVTILENMEDIELFRSITLRSKKALLLGVLCEKYDLVSKILEFETDSVSLN